MERAPPDRQASQKPGVQQRSGTAGERGGAEGGARAWPTAVNKRSPSSLNFTQVMDRSWPLSKMGRMVCCLCVVSPAFAPFLPRALASPFVPLSCRAFDSVPIQVRAQRDRTALWVRYHNVETGTSRRAAADGGSCPNDRGFWGRQDLPRAALRRQHIFAQVTARLVHLYHEPADLGAWGCGRRRCLWLGTDS